MPVIISVEGNIGSGKSTILEQIKNRMRFNPRVVFIKEPVDVWNSIVDHSTGENILQKFYGDQAKYAFSFQVMAYATRLSLIRGTIEANPDCDIIVCERSLDADKEIFAKMLHDDGMIDDVQYQIYQHFYKEYSNLYYLSGIIYIDADADVCERRVHKRLRDGETSISLDYLTKCKRYHDEWLLDKERWNNTTNDIKVLRLQTNADVTYDINDKNDLGNKWVNQIEMCIHSHLACIDESSCNRRCNEVSGEVAYTENGHERDEHKFSGGIKCSASNKIKVC